MILVVGNTKGGVGKSTLAVNIAIERANSKKVVLVDGDEQQSSALFHASRALYDYDTQCFIGKNIYNEMPTLIEEYDDIIIDVGGWDSDSLRFSLLVSDVLLIPVIPQNFSAWALADMSKIVAKANKSRADEGINPVRSLAVLNKAYSRTSKDNGLIAIDIKEAAFELVPVVIVDRAVFNNAASDGLGITEYKPRNKLAIEELSQLIHYVYS